MNGKITEIAKEFVLPSLVIGPIVGGSVTAATSKNKEEFKKELSKGVLAGTVGDLATGVVLGLWNKRKNLR